MADQVERQIYNIYCDESCHLENDHQQVMVLGAIWCPLEKAREIAIKIREIKTHHGLSPTFEIKWIKVSPAKSSFYQDLLNYFFNNEDLCFRALVVPDKTKLQHELYGQDHDTWYYKMYYEMLRFIINPYYLETHRIYIDIKDTKSAVKINKLHDVLCTSFHDDDHLLIERIQPVRSHEVEQIQLTDFLTGIISYANRALTTSKTKLELVDQMKKKSHFSLVRTNLLSDRKLNIFIWNAREKQV